MAKTEETLKITPEIKVAALLDRYPQLEEVLIDLAPAFGKLRNPVLRRTVARVCTLRQAASVGGVPLPGLINRLREAVGMAPWEGGEIHEGKKHESQPDWVTSSLITRSLDARPLIEAGEHPASRVMAELQKLGSGQAFELITPFVPTPLVDLAGNRGFRVYTRREGPEIFKTYFAK